MTGNQELASNTCMEFKELIFKQNFQKEIKLSEKIKTKFTSIKKNNFEEKELVKGKKKTTK